ncbi:hypothetical protein HER32_12030 [Hymenobacter sp. BT18]|uniref:hypothetical protein n=1 Tax=Hymenobacter sp. BT18 TaxID=2835648 RepID=UPI00143E85E5|nr:hypothetical protein [Hymenobacter sp. BT18]QIX61871.1 hypothetical protein HER32_12030 [Hymenobacter sp. BT18]
MFWLLYNLFALVDGFCDALLYGGKGAESFAWNEHAPLLTRRALAVLAAVAAAVEALLAGPGEIEGVPLGLAWVLWNIPAAALSFSLFHNECYNFGRVLIREKTVARARKVFRFNYQSSTTTARWDFDGTARWVMAAAGVLWLGLGFLLHAKL